MRLILKGSEPRTITETRCASTTDLSTRQRARGAFEQIDKMEVRLQLVREQGWLCAFCMRRVEEGVCQGDREPTMKIAHRVPVAVESSRALDWGNLFGSCDGGQRSGGGVRTCDYRQGETTLRVDPSDRACVARLRFERRDTRTGLFLTSDAPELRRDVEETLNLNGGELPMYRQKIWELFLREVRHAHPRGHWELAVRRAFFERWRSRGGERLREYLGVVEYKLGLLDE